MSRLLEWWKDAYSSSEEYAKSEVNLQLDHCLSEVRQTLESTDLKKEEIEKIIKEALELFVHDCNYDE